MDAQVSKYLEDRSLAHGLHVVWWADVTPSQPDSHDLRLRGAARVGHLVLRILAMLQGDGTYGVTDIEVVCDTQLHVTMGKYQPRDRVSILTGTLDEALGKLRLMLESLQQELATALGTQGSAVGG